MDSGKHRFNSNILGVKGKLVNELSETRLNQILRKKNLSKSDAQAIESYLESAASKTPEQNRARFKLV